VGEQIAIKRAANEVIETKKNIEERKVKNLEQEDQKCHCKQTNSLPNVPKKTSEENFETYKIKRT
jgi:cell division protein FtsB